MSGAITHNKEPRLKITCQVRKIPFLYRRATSLPMVLSRDLTVSR